MRILPYNSTDNTSLLAHAFNSLNYNTDAQVELDDYCFNNTPNTSEKTSVSITKKKQILRKHSLSYV